MLEHGIGEQEALLGLSLYVLACMLGDCANTCQITNVIYRRLRTHAVGTIERTRLHR